MEFDFNTIVQLLWALIAAIFVYVIKPLIKAKVDDATLETIKKFAKIGVYAVEQTYDAGQGEAKKKLCGSKCESNTRI